MTEQLKQELMIELRRYQRAKREAEKCAPANGNIVLNRMYYDIKKLEGRINEENERRLKEPTYAHSDQSTQHAKTTVNRNGTIGNRYYLAISRLLTKIVS